MSVSVESLLDFFQLAKLVRPDLQLVEACLFQEGGEGAKQASVRVVGETVRQELPRIKS